MPVPVVAIFTGDAARRFERKGAAALENAGVGIVEKGRHGMCLARCGSRPPRLDRGLGSLRAGSSVKIIGGRGRWRLSSRARATPSSQARGLDIPSLGVRSFLTQVDSPQPTSLLPRPPPLPWPFRHSQPTSAAAAGHPKAPPAPAPPSRVRQHACLVSCTPSTLLPRPPLLSSDPRSALPPAPHSTNNAAHKRLRRRAPDQTLTSVVLRAGCDSEMETLVIEAHTPGASFPWSTNPNMIASATRTPSSSTRSRSASSAARTPSLPSRSAHHDESPAAHSPPRDASNLNPTYDAAAASQNSPNDDAASSSPTSSHSDDSLASAARHSSSGLGTPRRIKVKSLQHIQSFDSEELERMAHSQLPSVASVSEANEALPQFEISEMPVNDVIEMVAGLLTKITSTNDAQHAHMHSQIPSSDGAGLLSHHAQSVLSFHGKNIPSITILSYLSRIHKYCPATYEVFLSLLVYFDRMTTTINAGPLANLERDAQEFQRRNKTDIAEVPETDYDGKPAAASSADATPPSSVPRSHPVIPDQPTPPSPPLSDSESVPLSQFFVVDSFNIHRLVIAGVTCASKFFSDVFYTNSRYAKVGGLPLPELNHLELQFLVLNEFKLSISVEELEAYATMLVAFYAREVVSQRRDNSMDDVQNALPVVAEAAS
ncbi:hypothetical protein FH972_021001 [Carpinus fangiana]|uniref:Cyclin n=1 Tax=Carpinus fangiana TaxID=176857 RepID=A0A5N6KNP4_9ROSI|nr:hypothetical protein FH972_021001 [Carpinus fangiana]KAB8336691.1 hypothetical protein FH972_021001 [Carpinus fangiana]